MKPYRTLPLGFKEIYRIPWFCALSCITSEELQFSAKLLSNSFFSDTILEFVSFSDGKEDVVELPLIGVSWFLDGVFSCCHENTDEEAWCRAISLWLKELWGWGWFLFCVQEKKSIAEHQYWSFQSTSHNNYWIASWNHVNKFWSLNVPGRLCSITFSRCITPLLFFLMLNFTYHLNCCNYLVLQNTVWSSTILFNSFSDHWWICWIT